MVKQRGVMASGLDERGASEPPGRGVTPWPLPGSVRDVVLVGGSFDPPHRAHVQIAERVRATAAPAAWLLFVPAAWSPLKDGVSTTEARHRVAMVRIATAGVPQTGVWTDEVDRAAAGERSFTIDTLRRAAAIAPGVRLRLLMGADQAVLFHQWRDFREVLALGDPLVALRDPYSNRHVFAHAMMQTGAWSPREVEQWAGRCVTTGVPLLPDAATEVRQALLAGKPASGISALDPVVAAYIAANGLYRVGDGGSERGSAGLGAAPT